MEERNHPYPVLSRETFEHKGVQVEEVITRPREGVLKLIWCRPPFESTVVVGQPNLCAHMDYSPKPGDFPDKASARRKVQEAFDRHWGLQ